MRALHIVGVDFEFGLGVDDGAPAEDQIAAQLVGIDLLGVLAHRDLALEGAMPPPGGDALDQFAGLAVRHLVIDIGDDVGFLGAIDDEGAVEMTRRPLPGHLHARLMAHRAAAEQ